jgi:hypothetical protein
MTLMVQHLLAHMSDTLMGGEMQTGLDAIGVLNQAGEHLYSMHPWRFAQGKAALMDLRGQISGSAATWNPTTLQLTLTGAFTDYSFLAGDELQATDGTGVTDGFYPVASRDSANAVTLSTSISSGSPTDVEFVLTPYAIALPSDIRDIIAIIGTDVATRRITLSTLDQVLRAREVGSVNDAHWYAAVSWAGNAARLEIGPAAGSNVTGAFRIFYRSRWTQLRTDSVAVDVPDYIEALLVQVVRAFARGYVREDQASLSMRLAEIHAGPLFKTAVKSDGNIQPYFGRMRGGGPRRWHNRRSSDFYETTSMIDGPS